MRVVPGFVLFTVASIAATAANGQTASTTPLAAPSPAPSPFPGGMDPVAADFQLSLIVWLSTLALAGICSWAYFASRASDGSARAVETGKNGTSKNASAASPVTDKDLESSRISYGFWLIVAGFLITLAVVIVSMNHFRPGTPGSTATTADVVAVVTAVTGVIGTLTAAFFGIQAAGAGRSQALSALSDQMKNGSTTTATSYKIDPLAGPHKGNTRVSITGNGFTGANAVNFGSIPGVNAQMVNDGLIYVTTPEMPFDPKTPTENVRSDVDVTVIFPGAAAQNKVVGKFYYYTVEVERGVGADKAYIKYIKVYGAGLAGASQVQFDAYPPVPVEKATDFVLQIPVRKFVEEKPGAAAQGVSAGDKMDPVFQDVWSHIWNQDVDVTIIFGADSTASKRMPIGKYRIPQYDPPDETEPDTKAANSPVK